MITKAARSKIESFVRSAKALLTDFVAKRLQGEYGIWTDGSIIPVAELTATDSDARHTASLLRQRISHIKDTLPGSAEADTAEDRQRTATAIGQLIAEQAFTLLNRMAAIRMAGERGIIQPAIDRGFDSDGFTQYDAVTGGSSVASTFDRYTWYVYSVFDELSIELPGVFNRYSPYGLIWFDEMTLQKFFDLINAEDLSAFYDQATGETINFWHEDETLGWIFQYYNSLEERRKMRDESTKPRNSREMAVRNQFFTPDYVVQFLTDNTLGRIWWEMTGGKSEAIADFCRYLVHRPDEQFEPRAIKEPTEIKLMDPTCGSMHFGLYAFSVFEVIYMDAWDNHADTLLQKYQYEYDREGFRRQVPRLILENNIFGAEIDPRALQIAAVSLWLRAQKSWDEQGVEPAERPMIRKSNLVLAEPMPGNKKLLKQLTADLDTPMKKLVKTVWDKMSMAGEAGLLLKMEAEIDSVIDDVKRNWHKYKTGREMVLGLTDELIQQNEEIEAEKARVARLDKDEFFREVKTVLTKRISELSGKMSEDEGYENSLFSEDAARGLAFIELCLQRFDVIVMNPPFGEGSEGSSKYLDDNYPNWCKNLVCAFFIRMQEMLTNEGLVGAIFDRTVLLKTSYEEFRRSNICGNIRFCAETGWEVLEANVETSTLVLNKVASSSIGTIIDVLDVDTNNKSSRLLECIDNIINAQKDNQVYYNRTIEYLKLPNAVIGYKFNPNILGLFKQESLEQRSITPRRGITLMSDIHFRMFYEVVGPENHKLLYNGGGYTMFYTTYQDVAIWEKDGEIAASYPHYRPTGMDVQGRSGACYGKRGDILDAHILKDNMFFSVEGQGIPNISSDEACIADGYINSIISQYVINLFTGQHKHVGYVKLLPMPDYESKQAEIEAIVNEIIEIKRKWFSLDETNLEYHGLIAQMKIDGELREALERMQSKLSADYDRYQELVRQNDDLWMDLAAIDHDSDFRKTLNDYKSKRPYEELLSIDSASSHNVINGKTIAAEIVQELVGYAFGRWDMGYALRKKDTPKFGGIFDALPFMPAVASSRNFKLLDNPKHIEGDISYEDTKGMQSEGHIMIQSPYDFIPGGKRYFNLTDRVRKAMSLIWKDNAANIEAEIVKLLGAESLQAWLDNTGTGGFFEYHLNRYTKSRRKAPIYWPISTADGEPFVWIYYPTLNEDTLKKVVLNVDTQIEAQAAQLNKAEARADKVEVNNIRQRIDALKDLKEELQAVIALPYRPNHDDGVPVTAAPLRNLFTNRKWRTECEDNWTKLSSGDYDWAHLAYALRPSEIRTKARKDWCLALTHGIEELCENKPKEKKKRATKKVEPPTLGLFD